MPRPLKLPPGIRIRAGKFHYRMQIAGVEHAGTTGYAATAPNLTHAIAKMAEVRRSLEAGDGPVKLVPKPFTDAADSFLDWAKGEYAEHPNSAKRIGTSLVSLRAYFAKTPLHAITAGNVEDYKAWRRSNEIREITIRHDLHALSTLYQYAIKHNWARKNLVRDVEIPSEEDAIRQYVLTPGEEAVYFAAAAKYPQLHDAARLILLQGMRPEEVLALRPRDVDLKNLRLHIRSGKTRAAQRTLRLTPESAAILGRRMDGAWCFEGRVGQLTKLNGSHNKVLAKTKLKFVLYDFRHTFATRLAERGCPLATLAAILGHANLRTISRYVHPTRDSQWQAMEVYGEGKTVSDFCPTPGDLSSHSEALVGTYSQVAESASKSFISNVSD